MITLHNYGYPLNPTTHNHSPSSLQSKHTPITKRVFWSFHTDHFGEKKMSSWEHLKMGNKIVAFSSVGMRPNVLQKVDMINITKSGNLEMGNKVIVFSWVGIRPKVLRKVDRISVIKRGNWEMGIKVEVFSSVGIKPKVLRKFERENIVKSGNLEMGFEEMSLDDVEDEEEIDGPRKRFRERGVEKDYDRDPEFADILGSCLDDPQKAQSKMEDRLRKKKDKILHTKAGSGSPMKVTFNKFDFSNSYIWFEFYNPPHEKDISLICDTIRSWHIIGRLGGCNSMNMQLSQAPLDKRPSYDAVQGANVEPATFYNIGDFEIQENLARIWVDIGTTEPLLLDVLLNALTQISSDFVGIKQVIFGGSENENWQEGLSSEDGGYSVHKI